MVVSEDQQEALVGRYQVLSLLNTGLKRVLLKGLNSDYEYGIEGLESIFFGDELMHAGLQIGLFPIEERSADFSSQIFKLSRKNR
nr:GH36 C-terminal domain-containing protein [Salinicoccus roseus]